VRACRRGEASGRAQGPAGGRPGRGGTSDEARDSLSDIRKAAPGNRGGGTGQRAQVVSGAPRPGCSSTAGTGRCTGVPRSSCMAGDRSVPSGCAPRVQAPGPGRKQYNLWVPSGFGIRLCPTHEPCGAGENEISTITTGLFVRDLTRKPSSPQRRRSTSSHSHLDVPHECERRRGQAPWLNQFNHGQGTDSGRSSQPSGFRVCLFGLNRPVVTISMWCRF